MNLHFYPPGDDTSNSLNTSPAPLSILFFLYNFHQFFFICRYILHIAIHNQLIIHSTIKQMASDETVLQLQMMIDKSKW